MIFIQITIPLLIVFGILNLITGVSNDAVNFLGPATGTGVSRRRNLLYTASAGILLGSLISAGMMNITQNGIIHTTDFSLTEILSVSLAALIVNIALIDTYNTFKYPTSTTIALFFELIGGAFAVILIRNIGNGPEGLNVTEVLNTDKLFFIILGIVLSILIAFLMGFAGQFITRLIFSFRYRNRNKVLQSVFGGGAITAVTFLILKKSLSGYSIDDSLWHTLIFEHTPEMLITVFAGSTFIFFFLSLALDFDISKPVVLFGTFALALSFAANDLWNFIGLPVHGLNAIKENTEYLSFIPSSGINGSNTAVFYIFAASAVIMAATLFFSKKNRGVIETELSLMRYGNGEEGFQPLLISAYAVRSALKMKEALLRVIPEKMTNFVIKRYRNDAGKGTNGVCFDNIRAIVILTLAGLLISAGTYFGFPLSTTFVVFMTGIGAAIADNGWTKENAARRISGVIYIMGGWLLSAVVAFAGGFLLTPVLLFGKSFALTLLAILLFFRLYKTTYANKKINTDNLKLNKSENMSTEEQLPAGLEENIRKVIIDCSKIYFLSVNAFINEDKKGTKKMFKESELLLTEIEDIRAEMFETFVKMPSTDLSLQNKLIQSFDNLLGILKSVEFITGSMKEGFSKKGNRLTSQQISEMHNLAEEVSSYFNFLIHILKEKKFELTPELIDRQQAIISYIEDLRTAQLKKTKNGIGSVKGSLLVIEYLANTKTLLLFSVNFINAYRAVLEQPES